MSAKSESVNLKHGVNQSVFSYKHINRNIVVGIFTTSRSTTLYCCDGKARVACAQSFTLWQQATIEII